MKKLSPGTLLLGIFAVLFGLVGAYAAKQHLQQEEPEAVEAAVVARLTVPLASSDLPVGRKITVGDVMLKKMTHAEIEAADIPDGFMMNSRQLVGRTLREAVGKGHAFATTSLYPEGMGPDIASRLKPGRRAVTIAMEGNMAAAALITPGATVDVIFRAASDKKKLIPETTVTLLEGVEVLAIDQETFQGARNMHASKESTVSLSVTPKQAAVLKVTEGHGSLSLALRGPNDHTIAELNSPATLAGVLGLAQPQKPFATQIYRRGQLSTTVFGDGERNTTHEMLIPAETVSTPSSTPAETQKTAEDNRRGTPARTISSTKVINTPTAAPKPSASDKPSDNAWAQSASCCGDK